MKGGPMHSGSDCQGLHSTDSREVEHQGAALAAGRGSLGQSWDCTCDLDLVSSLASCHHVRVGRLLSLVGVQTLSHPWEVLFLQMPRLLKFAMHRLCSVDQGRIYLIHCKFAVADIPVPELSVCAPLLRATCSLGTYSSPELSPWQPLIKSS